MAAPGQAVHRGWLRILAALACYAAAESRALSSPAVLEDDAQAPVCLLQRTSAAAARTAAPPGQRKIDGNGGFDSVKWQGFDDAAVTTARSEELRRPHPAPAAKEQEVLGALPKVPKKPAKIQVQDDLRDTLKALLEHQISAIRSKSSSGSSSSEKLVREDELLRFQDDRLRQEDDELRQENRRLQQTLAQLSSSLNRSAAIAEPQTTASLVASLLTAREVPQAFTGPPDSKDQVKKDPHQKMKIMIYIGGTCILLTLYVTYHLYVFFYVRRSDEDGDGEIDMDDFREYMAENLCCGLGYHSAKKVAFVLLLAGAGFAFLWWQGIIQPFLKELTCYIYLGVVLALLGGVILAEMFSQFSETFHKMSHMLEKFMAFAHVDQAQGLAQAAMKQAGLQRG